VRYVDEIYWMIMTITTLTDEQVDHELSEDTYGDEGTTDTCADGNGRVAYRKLLNTNAGIWWRLVVDLLLLSFFGSGRCFYLGMMSLVLLS